MTEYLIIIEKAREQLRCLLPWLARRHSDWCNEKGDFRADERDNWVSSGRA